MWVQGTIRSECILAPPGEYYRTFSCTRYMAYRCIIQDRPMIGKLKSEPRTLRILSGCIEINASCVLAFISAVYLSSGNGAADAVSRTAAQPPAARSV